MDQLFFEDVAVGNAIPQREYGPLTIVDTVRWAGLQENWQHLHFDRNHVRQHNGLKTFIASGAYRQALLMRLLTDWLGPRGWLRKISVRHTYSTFEGDLMRFGARIVEKSAEPSDPWLLCELQGTNQEGKQILTGHCTVILPAGGCDNR
jgi:3-hydroxybutyryl-CoA dehydratase